MERAISILHHGIFLALALMIAQRSGAQFNDLNLQWSYHRNKEKKSYPATVPGTVYKDHVDQGLLEDPFLGINEREMSWMSNSDWTYETKPFSFESRQPHVLRFNGLDTYAEVYLNDSLILSCDNAFRIWDARVRFLSEGNVLRVQFHSPVARGLDLLKHHAWPIPGDSLRAITRKPQCHFGWDWGPQYLSCGITGKVQVRSEQEMHISTFISTTSSANEQEASLWFRVDVESPWDTTLTFTLTNHFQLPDFTQEVILHRGSNTIAFPLHVNTPPLWYCNGQGFPNLIDFTASLRTDSVILAQRTIRSGIRSAQWIIKPDSIGESFYLELNGHPVFVKGVNVIPVALYPLPALEKRDIYTRFIQKLRRANINMVRVWGGGMYEDDLFYELCDEMGIMVWQDFMFACSMYPATEAFLNNVAHEAEDQLRRLSHHPSIVIWCGNNENAEGWSRWGWKDGLSQEQVDHITEDDRKLFLELLPSKVFEIGRSTYWSSSPKWGRGDARSMVEGDCHYWGVWHDEQPWEVLEQKIPRFMSEFGVQSYPSTQVLERIKLERHAEDDPGYQQHQKHPRGFRLMKDYTQRWYKGIEPDDANYPLLTQAMQAEGVVRAILAQRLASPRCMGTMFWQWNDVWPAFSWSAVDALGQDKLLAQVLFEAYAPEVLVCVPYDRGAKIHWISDHHVDADSVWLDCAIYAADDLPREPNPNGIEPAVPLLTTSQKVAVGTGVIQLADIAWRDFDRVKNRTFLRWGSDMVIDMKLRSLTDHNVIYRRIQKLMPETNRHIIPVLQFYSSYGEKTGNESIPVVMYRALKN